MIKYDYSLERNEGNEYAHFSPKMIPTELPPLVYIEGPNSSGKSTLLNLIALAFNGNKRKDVNENLKNKIEALVDHSYQSLKFRIEINEQNNVLIFTKNFNSTKIDRIFRETASNTEKILSTDLINEKYNLIYDIPENPITRLNDMNNNLKLEQNKLIQKTTDTIDKYRTILYDVKSSQDPDKIKILEEEIIQHQSLYDQISMEVNEEIIRLQILSKYIYTRAHNRVVLDLKELDQKIVLINKTLKTKERRKEKSKEQIENEISECNLRIKRDVDNVVTNLKMAKVENNRIHEFEKINLDTIKKTMVVPQGYFILVDETISMLTKIDRTKSRKIQSRLSAYAELVRVLEKYQDDDIELPGEFHKFHDLLIVLKKEIVKENIENSSALAIDDAIDYLKELKGTLEYVNTIIIPKLKTVVNSKEYEGYENKVSEYELNKLLEKQSKLKKTVIELSNLCIQNNVNLTDDSSIRSAIENVYLVPNCDKYRKNTDDENFSYVEIQSNMLDKKKKKLSMIEDLIQRNTIDLEKMKSMKPHILHGKAEIIDEIIRNLQKTQKQLKKYSEYLDTLITKNEASEKDNNINFYFDKVAIYLGRQLSSIRHIDKTYDVNKIDLIHQQIITTENKIIRFSDMGTGQSQAAYLMSKLATIDERKIVVLFDEVAMMDKVSLRPVFNKLKELYDDGKLVCAVVVQKADSIRVLPLEESL